MRQSLISSCIGGLSLVAALASTPTPAHACGGFFCNSSQPVNQAAERIIFSRDSDGDVTALIQIQYSGPSEQFAWMLPVVGSPEISVSSNAAFNRLQAATNPSYRLVTTVEGTCEDDSRFFPSSDFSGGGADAGLAAGDAGMEPPVTVLDQGAVGPYDFIIIAVNPDAEDLAAEALTWLRDNGYDVNDFGGDLLGLYLEQGMNLLAFRLTKGNSAGSIRPVRLSFGAGVPSIPIRPTAVAATDDMGVMVWVLGESRAIPANYRHLELNEALINWINPASNYNDVVTRAANEAGGQGFVTEMAGAATPLAESIFSSREQSSWETILATDWGRREAELIQVSSNNFAALDGMRELFKRHIPVPEGIDEDAFLACVSCYIFDEADIEGFEPDAFLADMARDVIAPMQETRALFEDAQYVTRLYTTMSAHEMTMDPIFDFNADLGDVTNVHTADRVIECTPSLSRSEAPWRTTFANGDVVRGFGSAWPFSADEDAMPANRRVLRVGTTGLGAVLEDNASTIRSALSDHNATVPTPSATVRGGGCSAASGGSGFALMGLMVLGLMRRRRA